MQLMPKVELDQHNTKFETDFDLIVLGGCELGVMHKRSVTMVNNSEKLYHFQWETVECLLIKPTVGYISPGEEKDIEITFFSVQPVSIKKVFWNRVKRFFKYDPLLV